MVAISSTSNECSGKELVLSPFGEKRELSTPLEAVKKKNKVKEKIVVLPNEMKKITKIHENESSGYGIRFGCRPSRLCDLILNLNDAQKSAIKSIGFGGILSLHGWNYIPWMKLYWFIDHFDPIRRILEFKGGRHIVLTAAHVEDLFLLPRKQGNNVELLGRNSNDETSHFLEEIKSRYGLGDKVNEKSVHDLLKNNKQEELQGCGDDFKILFVLYAFSTFLAQTPNFLIELPLIKSLIDVDKISSFDWCPFIVEKLCNALRSFKQHKSRKHVSGCLLVLPLLYFHQFMWLGLPEKSSLPLIKHWTSSTFTKRLDSEIQGGSKFGQGKWVEEGTYPVSENAKCEDVNPTEAANHIDDVFDDNYVSLDDIPIDEDHEDAGDQELITYKLPRDEPNNIQIKAMSKNVVHMSFFMLKRDFNVIMYNYMERIKEIKKQGDKQETSTTARPPPPSMSESQEF